MIPAIFNRRCIEYVGGVTLLAIVYIASARFGLSLAFIHESVTAIWPPTGIALAALILFGYRWWPGIFLGAFMANVIDTPAFPSLGIAVGNTLEALIGSYLVVTYASGVHAFEKVRDVVAYVSFAAFTAPAVSATIGVVCLTLAGLVASGTYETVWFTWWLGDAVSAIIITPVLLLWAANYRFSWGVWRAFELLAFSVVLVVVVRMIFGEIIIGDRGYTVFTMPLLVWIALRFSPRETATAVLAVAVLAAWGTLERLGPFADRASINESLLLLQLFVGVIAITSLILAVVVSERKKGEIALQRADHAKDEFLASLSHELRSPLSAVFGYVQLLKLANDASAREKALDAVNAELRHITNLLEDLLDLSRIRRGRMRIHAEPIDVNVVVDEAAATVHPLMKEHRHTLYIETASEPLWMSGDKSRLKQILINL
ncbi:MAG: MASE1 domain-containing protein, partial [bacterium]|nr:MASE1 domain-containing protein [bacterium]